MKRWGKQMLLGLCLITLSGCVTYPIAKSLQQQAKPVTPSEVVENPGTYQGTIVIWGGRIIKTVNDVSNSAIYILDLPLAGSGKPMLYANSTGRFIASSRGFLDPEIYKNGMLITVAGTVSGVESKPVQNSKYNYPVLDIKQAHLWPVQQRYEYYPYLGWGYYPYYPYYYPGWSWGWSPGWGIGWGWYYGGDWDGDRGYYYHHYDDGGGYHYHGSPGGAYHYHYNGNSGGAYHYHYNGAEHRRR